MQQPFEGEGRSPPPHMLSPALTLMMRLTSVDCYMPTFERLKCSEIVHTSSFMLDKSPVLIDIGPRWLGNFSSAARFTERGLRDPDHRFEWTQAQFREWAGGLAAAYSYKVGPGSTAWNPVNGIVTAQLDLS